RTFETPSCFSKIDATFRRSKTFADPFSPSASSCFLNHHHRRMGKAGWPSLSICALHVNVPPMTIDASVDVGGNALLDFGVVILAAGASSRMGQPKLLLPWGGTSVLGHLIAQWDALRAGQIAAVLAASDRAVSAELDRLDFPEGNRVVNPIPERGMFSSIQCAARWDGWNAELTHWAIVLGDQPHLRLGTLRALLDFANAQSIQVCQPSRRGRPRHPVVVPEKGFLELKNARAETLKDFLQTLPSSAALCELDDPGLDFDVDTPADYEQAIRLFCER